MNSALSSCLPPDQAHVFRTARHWRDFRALFPTTAAALEGHVIGAFELSSGTVSPTHELRWRIIYQNRESRRRQIFSLLLLPLGHVATAHAEFHFVTRHAFSPSETRRLYFGRFLGSAAYHACFIGGIAAGVAAIVAGFMLALADSGAAEIMTLIVAGLALTGCLSAAGRTRSLGLPSSLLPIAKDSFDLVSIHRVQRG